MDTMSSVDPQPNEIFDSELLDQVNRMIQKKIDDGQLTKDEAWEEFRKDLAYRMRSTVNGKPSYKK